jgi:hypothetical protein
MPFIWVKLLPRMFFPSTQNVFGPTHYLLMFILYQVYSGCTQPFTKEHNFLEHNILQ